MDCLLMQQEGHVNHSFSYGALNVGIMINVIALIVQAHRDSLGGGGEGYCADLSTSMKFGTDVDQNILNLFF